MIFLTPCRRLSCHFQIFDSLMKESIIFLTEVFAENTREPALCVSAHGVHFYSLSTQVCFRINNNNFFWVLQRKSPSKIRDDIKLNHSFYHRQWSNQEFRNVIEDYNWVSAKICMLKCMDMPKCCVGALLYKPCQAGVDIGTLTFGLKQQAGWLQVSWRQAQPVSWFSNMSVISDTK